MATHDLSRRTARNVDASARVCHTRLDSDDTPTTSDDVGWGGARVGAGRPSAFPGSTAEKVCYMDFTAAGRKALARIVQRTGLSRNDVLAHLVDRYVDALNFSIEADQRSDLDELPAVEFPGKLAAN